MMRAVPALGEMMVSCPSPHLTWYRTLNSPTVTFRTSPSRAGEPTWVESITMMSPGRAIAAEEVRVDGALERSDAFRGIFVVASLRVTFFDVPVLTVALLEAVLLAVVFFAAVFPALVLLAVVLFVGTVRLPYPSGFLQPTSST
jgi:hypothetical protein